MKNKIEIIIRGVLVPFVIFVGITVFVNLLLNCIFNNSDKVNSLLSQGVANIALMAILIPYYYALRKDYNLKNGEFVFRYFYFIIPLAFSVCIICNILIDFMPNAKDNAVTKEVMELTQNYSIGLSLLIVGVVVPIVEELVFRGLFYDAISLISNEFIAIILTSIFFAFAHGNLEQGIYAFVAGLFLAYVKYKYKRVIYTIWMHLLMNVTSLVFVPSILELNTFKEKMFVVFIGLAILGLTLVRGRI